MSINTVVTMRSNIEDKLEEIGCCSYCILRFLDEKSQIKYIDLEANWKVGVIEPKRRKVGTCVACLNILNGISVPAVVDKMLASMSSEQEYLDYVFALSAPSCLTFRQYMVLAQMRKHFPSFYATIELSNIMSVKDVWKTIVSPYLDKSLGKLYNTSSEFSINVGFDYPENHLECVTFWQVVDVKKKDEARKSRKMVEMLSRGGIEKALADRDGQSFLDSLLKSIRLESDMHCTISTISFTHGTIYLGGRYNKYSRKLPQTPWIIDSKRVIESSVQELICQTIQPYVKAEEVKFTSSGREDVDVRTLGRGRPFVLQFISPKKVFFSAEVLKKIQVEVNAETKEIAVRDLQLVSKDSLGILKMGEENKKKTYSGKCYSCTPLKQEDFDCLKTFQNVALCQKTPIRVLHRRPLAEREKIVHSLSASLIDSHHFRFEMVAQAGTYIKEFMHGDFGRTTPNICEILDRDIDILELDVEAIDQDWPPRLPD